MQVSINPDFEKKVWKRYFPDEDLRDFYTKIFDIIINRRTNN